MECAVAGIGAMKTSSRSETPIRSEIIVKAIVGRVRGGEMEEVNEGLTMISEKGSGWEAPLAVRHQADRPESGDA